MAFSLIFLFVLLVIGLLLKIGILVCQFLLAIMEDAKRKK